MDGLKVVVDETATTYHEVNMSEMNLSREPHRFTALCWCEPQWVELGKDHGGRPMKLYRHLEPRTQTQELELPLPLIEVVATTALIIPATMEDLKALEEGE